MESQPDNVLLPTAEQQSAIPDSQPTDPVETAAKKILQTPVTRKNLLRGILGGTLAALLRSAGSVQAPSNLNLSDEEFQNRPKSSEEKTKIITHETLSVSLDEENIPLSYTVDGIEHIFTPEEKLQFLDAKKHAVELNEVEPIKYIPFTVDQPTQKVESEENPAQPVTTELPTDILSKEELKERGVSVVTSHKKDAAQFYIRKGAFEAGGILEPLALYNQHASPEEKMDLVYIIVNGNNISGRFRDEPQFEPYKDLAPYTGLPETIDSYRTTQIKSLQQQIDAARKNLGEAATYSDFQQLTQDLISLKETMMMYEKLPEEEILDLIQDDEPYGLQDDMYDDEKGFSTNTAFILVAAGKAFGSPTPKSYILSFSPFGEVLATTRDSIRPQSITDMTPTVHDTHLSPDRIPTQQGGNERNENAYLIDVDKRIPPGFIVYHETMHDQQVRVLPALAKKGLLNLLSIYNIITTYDQLPESNANLLGNNDFGLARPNLDEYAADVFAVEQIKRASDLWKKSQYRNDFGYSFVFSIPPSEERPYVSYILTSKSPSSIDHTLSQRDSSS
ncbi:hypothetical protein COU89_01400 [Candidatus Roizmanbacteria bacterium CG10_big_fil_rev_8_21_14_0_10_45_7]|uniref:Uncharacterized protein n=1 Tax=Candidatus Roizmanbacteria bacterium CG10_big_fil_rev_8_21_14_0_10_45_7 TaxID=1974854 RepID=A0A2M8KV22_9BACT|nr:MAG: hypothetical protein COU89_01400 [Candidatus Roizmanbacteria bacterium CG10_big_fil_rev_8_21_14_0_10_45_7]